MYGVMVYTHNNVLIWSIRYRIRLDVWGQMQLQAKIHTYCGNRIQTFSKASWWPLLYSRCKYGSVWTGIGCHAPMPRNNVILTLYPCYLVNVGKIIYLLAKHIIYNFERVTYLGFTWNNLDCRIVINIFTWSTFLMKYNITVYTVIVLTYNILSLISFLLILR